MYRIVIAAHNNMSATRPKFERVVSSHASLDAAKKELAAYVGSFFAQGTDYYIVDKSGRTA
jgi:hypothetical protein